MRPADEIKEKVEVPILQGDRLAECELFAKVDQLRSNVIADLTLRETKIFDD